MTLRKALGWIAAFVVAGCGDDDSGSSTATESTTEMTGSTVTNAMTTATMTTAGTEPNMTTAPGDTGSSTSEPTSGGLDDTTTASGSTDDATGTSTDAGSSSESTDGGSSSESSESSSSDGGMDDAGMCVMQGGSCAAGEPCCANLDCCSGVPVPVGQEFCSPMCPISDRNQKENFELVDPEAILDKVVTIPITTWNYKHEDPSVRHIGAMAQDFQATFRVGATDKSIFVVDADGVALASVQALHGKLRQAQADNAALREELDALSRRLDAIERAGSRDAER